MIRFLYDLPNWQMGVLVVGALIAVSLGMHVVFRQFVRLDISEDGRELAMTVLGIVATMNALLLAFSAVSVWDAHEEADAAVAAEADTIGELGSDLAVYGGPDAVGARQQLRDYVRLVIDHEWAAMRDGKASEPAWRVFDSMFRRIGAIEPDTQRRAALLPEIWHRINELLDHRRQRLYTSQDTVPSVLWGVVLAGTALTMAVTFVLPATRFNLVANGVLALSMGLVLYLILALDRPFTGNQNIGPAPLESVLERMQRWDRESAN